MPESLHDSDVWEIQSGWIFGCRTCLEHTVYDAEADALTRKQVHDSRALPWWVAVFADSPPTRCTTPVGAHQHSESCRVGPWLPEESGS